MFRLRKIKNIKSLGETGAQSVTFASGTETKYQLLYSRQEVSLTLKGSVRRKQNSLSFQSLGDKHHNQTHWVRFLFSS